MGCATRRGGAGLILALAVAQLGCATDYVARTAAVRRAYQSYDYDRALELLERERESAVDQVLYLLDRGMLLHAQGKPAESNAALSAAEKAAAAIDVISVSEEAKVLLSSEREKAYRGEDFELLLINVLKALNYVRLADREAALVEVRRLNERLRKMVLEEKKPYEQLAIARYLGGLLYEDAGELDSAWIDYRAAAERMGDLGTLAGPLMRLARQTGRDVEYEALRARYPHADDSPLGPHEGEVVVVLEYGLSPKKRSTQPPAGVNLVAVPAYAPRYYPRELARVRSETGETRAERVTSVEAVAQLYLADRIGRIAAKSMAGTAVKAGVAAGVGRATGSRELGWLTFLILSSASQPDLRSWLSLPAEFQVARMRLPAGRRRLIVETERRSEEVEVEVAPRAIAIVVIRQY